MADTSIDNLLPLLRRTRFITDCEDAMQQGVATALARAGVAFEREVGNAGGRIDFRLGRVGLECKVQGSISEVTRQLFDYAVTGEFDLLVLLTTVPRHARIQSPLSGVQLVVVVANAGGLL